MTNFEKLYIELLDDKYEKEKAKEEKLERQEEKE